MNIPTWIWIVTFVVTIAVLSFDVIAIARHPHVPSLRECTLALSVYVGAAVLFGIGVGLVAGWDFGTQFFAGWITEYSLSVDNLFVFIVIMSKFGVPEKLQQTALMAGIIIALVLRGIFIGLGAGLINQFAWMFYLFAIFLIYTAVKLAMEGLGEDHDQDEFTENRFLAWVRKRLGATSSWEFGPKLYGHVNGKKVATPMLVTVIALGTTDLMFALDSIPAIFGLTAEPYIVFTANVFALMGLRQLYFLLGGLLQRLIYLSLGLAVMLAFIGVKLILHALHENTLPFINGGRPLHQVPEVSIGLSLGVIVGVLAITTVASLIKTRKDARA